MEREEGRLDSTWANKHTELDSERRANCTFEDAVIVLAVMKRGSEVPWAHLPALECFDLLSLWGERSEAELEIYTSRRARYFKRGQRSWLAGASVPGGYD